ncbi:MAG: UDP-N-acetylmuramate dehydrogenase [Propionibacteriaceae bacterium]|nr:UDP-N-acetylmuramate dehydrogenase [Propionibacteriaceae bacterium]
MTREGYATMSRFLADHTTTRVGGPARRFATASTAEELIATVKDCDERGEAVFILGGGSNVLASDDGFDGTVVRVATTGIATADVMTCSGAFLNVAAGENLDDLVCHAVEHGYSGIESLSGIPGQVGASVIQNAGAYGQEVGQTVARIRTWDRKERKIHTFGVFDARLGYRTSIFKENPGRWVVLEVGFQFNLGDLSKPIRSAEVAQRLGVRTGERAPLAAVRQATLAVRKTKGMVLDAADHDTWSTGSFFVNPIISAVQAELLPPDAPRFAVGGKCKTSAAWLIEHAGFSKGFGEGAATLSNKHVLALSNRGGATAADILALAKVIREGVRTVFGITLVSEPVLLGLSLD